MSARNSVLELFVHKNYLNGNIQINIEIFNTNNQYVVGFLSLLIRILFLLLSKQCCERWGHVISNILHT